MTIFDHLRLRNAERRTQWAWRWHKQGGGPTWTARDLLDLRTDAEREMWRRTEHALRSTPTAKAAKRKVVNLVHWKFERIRRKARSSI